MAEFQSRIPIAALWGDGDKASADMMSVDASRHLWNARVDPRRRTYATGIYTHVRDRWGTVCKSGLKALCRNRTSMSRIA